MEPLNQSLPLQAPEWALAYKRVESYLRAFQVENRLLLSELTHRILRASHDRALQGDRRAPCTIAIDECNRFIHEWTIRILKSSGKEITLQHARGRAALYLARVPQRWPLAFLEGDSAPAELQAELRTVYLDAGPDLTFSSMTPRKIDLGPVSAAADETWRTFAKWPVLRSIVIWAGSIALAIAAFYLTRF